MLKIFESKKPKLRATEIKKREGYLGTYQVSVAVGNGQQMVFSPTDAGPCWMLPEELEAKKKEKNILLPQGTEFHKKNY
jgi:hypothetical protein